MIADFAPPLRARRTRARSRAGVVLVVVAGLLAAWALAMGGGGAATTGASTVVVLPGQTLWAIAESHFPGDDVRARIAEIESLNGLRGAVVQPGETIVLPQGG